MEDLLSDLSELGIELEPDQLERFQNNLKINKTFASIAKSTSLLRNKKGISQDLLVAFSGIPRMTGLCFAHCILWLYTNDSLIH